MKKSSPTRAEAIERVLAKVNGPIKLNDLVKKVLETYPSSGKKPDAGIRHKLKMEEVGKSIVFLDDKTILPLHVGIPGVRFRISLSRWQANKGFLPVYPSFQGWDSYIREMKDFQLIDKQGNRLPTDTVSVKHNISGFKGDFEMDVFQLNPWFQKHDVRRNDSILVTIESWKPRRFRLEFEPEKKRRVHYKEIEYKNQELADTLFDMLESAAQERIYVIRAIPTAYLRLSDPRGYPGDHWTKVIRKDSRLRKSDFYITYPETRNMMERMLTEGVPVVDEQEFTPEQGEQVYQFRASLRYGRDSLRRVEIQGNYTLADFDFILRSEFGHDSDDHIGGFWKLVRRGQTRKFRKVELGNVNPFGEGTGADIRIAGLGLHVGDRLTYVYDFGDWIEHEIILEKVISP